MGARRVNTTKPPPEHGDPRCYRHGCRCRPCTDAVARQAKARVHAHNSGTWQPRHVDAAPARARLTAWRNAHYSWREIADATHVPEDVLRQAALGKPTRPASRTMLRTNAEKILAAAMKPGRRAPGAFVDATGTVRRLQALAVNGWHLGLLSDATGISITALGAIRRGRFPTVRAHTADAVRRTYERIGDTKPDAYGHASKDIVATASRAARNRWTPPRQWGDDMDLADALPQAPTSIARPLQIAEDTDWIRRTTGVEDRELIAERIGVTRKALKRNLERAKTMRREPVAA